MADISWARKYRPRNIEEYMGDTLRRVIDNRLKDRSNIPQTIFLEGTRGCGKTTGARLLAKEILCLSPVNGRACGKCEMCQEIDEYISSSENGAECMGITEVNAAEKTGKEYVESVVEDMCIEPQYPLKYKVLILDECHSLSKSAQNALLKPIEEPPEHLIIILCTTDPQNVLDTIKSRMQLTIHVRKQSVEELSKRLLFVAKEENLNTSIEALKIIAKKSDRVPREALNMLEGIAKEYNNVVTVETVRDATGEVASELYVEFFKCANSSLEDIMAFIKGLKDKGMTTKDFISGLTRFVLDCLNVKCLVGIEDYSEGFVLQAKGMFSMYKSKDFDMLLQVMEYANKMACTGDETQGELILANTALRVGKVEILANGSLENNIKDAEKENKKSFSRYRDNINEERVISADNIESKEITSMDLASIMGKGLSEVKMDNHIPLCSSTEEDNDAKNGSDDNKYTFEQLTDLLGN